MTNLRRADIQFADSQSIDAFGRLRVGNPVTLFDSKLLFGKNDVVWDEHINNASGSAASTHTTNRVTMDVGANANDRVIRQTKMRFNYLPGKSHAMFITFVLGNDSGTIKRLGYFNASTTSPYNATRDGIYLEHDGTNVYIVQSRAGTTTNTRIVQSSWNFDTFDGSGPSGKTIDWADAQIMLIDLEWLGVGRVRVAFVIDGKIYTAHEFNNANGEIQAIVQPYIDSPNHSIRYEIYSDGSAGSMTAICSSVQSEGGYNLAGNLFSADRAATSFTTAANTSINPLVGLRLRSDRPDGTIIALSASILCTSTAQFRWSLLLNPTVAGTDAASWTSVGGNSAAQYDVSRDNTNLLTGGTQIASGYLEDTNQAGGAIDLRLNSAVRPGIDIDGGQDELVLAVQNLSAAAETYYASINWREPL